MMQSQAPPEVPSYWLPYFAVDDCDATVAQAQSGGATVFLPPMDYPGVGRFSVLADPQGAVFSVIKLELGPHQ
jgi:predicted enzyme related to lactoylglutathione lyase